MKVYVILPMWHSAKIQITPELMSCFLVWKLGEFYFLESQKGWG